jgi:hypothetical protein
MFPAVADKLISDARVGIFLGYAKTLKNVLYFNTLSKTVKTDQHHIAFDEAMNDLVDKPPNARLLGPTPSDSDPDLVDLTSTLVAEFNITLQPFGELIYVQWTLDSSSFYYASNSPWFLVLPIFLLTTLHLLLHRVG